jgi:hypothetical protein
MGLFLYRFLLPNTPSLSFIQVPCKNKTLAVFFSFFSYHTKQPLADSLLPTGKERG